MKKKQQILVIHGGDAFERYEDYLQSLREKELTLERLKQKDWKSTLQSELGEDYEVFTPRLPNPQNARYAEWKIIFEKILSLMHDNLMLVGHSLGGLFLAKYVSEETLHKKIRAIIFIAAPYSTKEHEPIADFVLTGSFASPVSGEAALRMTGGKILLFHSRDDVVVPFVNAEKYKAALPEAELKVFADRGHFNQESFPEIVETIKQLSI